MTQISQVGLYRQCNFFNGLLYILTLQLMLDGIVVAVVMSFTVNNFF